MIWLILFLVFVLLIFGFMAWAWSQVAAVPSDSRYWRKQRKLHDQHDR